MSKLAGRTYIVTGAGSGIGAATVARLIEDGANVVAVDLDQAAAQKTLDGLGLDAGRAVAVGVDVSDEDKVDAMTAEGIAKFGGLDGVVNCAGVRGVGLYLGVEFVDSVDEPERILLRHTREHFGDGKRIDATSHRTSPRLRGGPCH